MFDLPAYVWLLVLVGAIGIPAVTSMALYRGGLAAGLSRGTAGTVAALAGAGWAGWVVTTAVLADAGAFRQSPDRVRPWLPIAFLAALAAPLLATRIPVVARILAAPGTPARLAVPQAVRVVGGAFVVVMALGKLPAVFALPAGFGDMAIGISAPFVACRLAARQPADRATRTRAVWFNILGIVDLVVAVTLGFLAGLGPHRPLAVTPSTVAVSLLPLVLIPLTAVPLALALHIVSLSRLRTRVPVAA